MSERVFAPSDGRLSHSLHSYATILQATGRGAEAIPLHERALRIREQSYTANHPYVAATLSALVSLYLEQGRYTEAEPAALRALQIWENEAGPGSPEHGRCVKQSCAGVSIPETFCRGGAALSSSGRHSRETKQPRSSEAACKPR